MVSPGASNNVVAVGCDADARQPPSRKSMGSQDGLKDQVTLVSRVIK